MVEIRRARQSDVSELVNLVLQYIDFYERSRPEFRRVRELVQRLLEDPSVGRQFVAYGDGRMLGFATLYFTFSTLRARKVAILNDLYVVPGSRREGVGTRLLEGCLTFVRKNGYAHMEWVTSPDNSGAQALYEKIGAEREEWIQFSI